MSLRGIGLGRLLCLLALLVLAVPACGPRVQAPQVDDSDYVFPELVPGELAPRDEKSLRSAWSDVLTGQTARAEIALNKLLAVQPGLRPAQIVLGFSSLRANRLQAAETIFSSVLRSAPDDLAALLGAASVRKKEGALDEALPLYSRASRLRPRDGTLARRVSEVKLSVAESAMARASSLSAEGRKPEAILMLGKVLDVAPELSSVRLELADLLIEAGRRDEALLVLGAAQDTDRNIVLRIATLRFEDEDLDGAEMALKRGIPDVAEDAEAASLLARIRDQRSFLALPEQLRALGTAVRVTRAELAALVVVRIDALKSRKPGGRGEVASDLSRTWARSQIVRAIALGIMDVYPNHTFQPTGVVRRGELAVVAARVLDLVGWGRSNLSGAAPKDMSPSHLQYASVVRVVGAGVMQNAASGGFEPWRIVSGADAKAVIDALARLTAQR